ncbi:MAG: hypothetical protein N2C14_31430, partial [Planctomycetales bacterium]
SKASREDSAIGHDAARRIMNRDHLRVLYERNPNDQKKNVGAVSAIFDAVKEEFGEANVRMKEQPSKDEGAVFPVQNRDKRIVSSISTSQVLENLPATTHGYVFIVPELRKQADSWLKENREEILSTPPVEDE